MKPVDRDSTVAILTTYHPEPGLTGRVAALLPQIKRLLIVDNGSASEEQYEIRDLVDKGNADAVWNRTNLGLATALDQGLAWAAEQNAEWALLLDQDSHARQNIVGEAARVLHAAGSDNGVAAIGAGILGEDNPESAEGTEAWREERVVITSGTLVSVAAWRALGGFRRDFFVDYVDIEFCLRARSAGFRIVRSLNPTIAHVIGRPQRRRLAGRTVTPTFHDPARRYAITRNRIVVWRMYWRKELAFVVADGWAFLKEMVKIVLLEDARPAKVRAIGRGVRQGFRDEAARP